MLSRVIGDAEVALRLMAFEVGDAAAQADATAARVDVAIDGIGRRWHGPAPSDFARTAALATSAVRSWPSHVEFAAGVLRQWSIHAGNIATDARRAESRLAMAFDEDGADRDVLVRSARSLVREVGEQWVDICRRHRLELIEPIATIAAAAERSWGDGGSHRAAADIATHVAALGMDLDFLDRTGSIQDRIDELLTQFENSPAAALAFVILETARDRDLFTADGVLSHDDLAAADPRWVREAVGAWQQATGTELDPETADAIATLIPTVAAMMLADQERDWTDEAFEPEPQLRALLADAAVAALTKRPNLLEDYYDGSAGPIEQFTELGGGGLDHLPDNPTSSEWSYHLHGPPSIGHGFETSSVFRALVFDWHQVVGGDASWGGGLLEVMMALPISKPGKLGTFVRAVDQFDDALDLSRIAHRVDGATDVAKTLDRLDDLSDAHVTELLDAVTSSDRVLQGGLAAHEGASRGHTIAEHAGRTHQQLAERARSQGRPFVSTFQDVERAEHGVEQVLRSQAPEVIEWMGTSAQKRTFVADIDDVVGVVYDASNGSVRQSSRVRIVLRRDPTMPMGFRVQTAFVE